jgi:hypothetical protein
MSQPFGSMPDSNNPFSPQQAINYATQPATKPTMAKVFGILNLVFGGLSLVGQVFGVITILFLRSKIEEFSQQTIPMPGVLQWIANGIQLLLTFWLIYSGVRVMNGTMSGRSAFIVYCLGSLLIRPFLVVINVFAQFDQMEQQMAANGAGLPQGALMGMMAVGGLFALVLAEVYEAVGFFVIRSKNVTQQFQAWDDVVNVQRPNETFNFK